MERIRVEISSIHQHFIGNVHCPGTWKSPGRECVPSWNLTDSGCVPVHYVWIPMTAAHNWWLFFYPQPYCHLTQTFHWWTISKRHSCERHMDIDKFITAITLDKCVCLHRLKDSTVSSWAHGGRKQIPGCLAAGRAATSALCLRLGYYIIKFGLGCCFLRDYGSIWLLEQVPACEIEVLSWLPLSLSISFREFIENQHRLACQRLMNWCYDLGPKDAGEL